MGLKLLIINQQIEAWSDSGRRLRFTTRHEAVLLGALALAEGRELLRAELAQGLWPETDFESARVNLRRRIADLRRLAGTRVEADRRWISLAMAGIEVRTGPGAALDACTALADRSEPTRLLWSQNDESLLEDWLAAWAECRPAPSLTLGREKLLMRASAKDASARSRVLAACGASALGLQPPDRSLVWRLANNAADEPELQPAAACLFDLTSLALHRSGSWTAAQAAAKKCLELSQASGMEQRALFSRFRLARMRQDTGGGRLRPDLLRALSSSRRTPEALQATAALNLVFAHFLHESPEDAAREAKEQRGSRKFSTPEHEGWLLLNLALSEAMAGRAADSARTILEANSLLNPLPGTLDHHWMWQTTVDAFAAAGWGRQAAIAERLSDRAMTLRGEAATPLNRARIQRRLSQAAREMSASDWLEAICEADEMPLQESHAFLMDELRQMAAGRPPRCA